MSREWFAFPNQFRRVPKWIGGTDLRPCGKSLNPAKYLLMKDLTGTPFKAGIAAARALEGCMSAFHMKS